MRGCLASRNLILVLALLSVGPNALGEEDPFDFDLSKPASEVAGGWRLSGFLEARGRHFLTDDDWLSTRLFGQAEITYRRDAWQYFVLASAEHDDAKTGYRGAFRDELREAYVRYDGPRLDLTIGKQRVGWGTADGVSTIDRVNAVDFRDPIGNARTAARRPSWLARLEATTDVGIIDLVWLPRGRDRKFAEFGSPWESHSIHMLRRTARELGQEVEFHSPEAHEGGVRFLRYGQGFDWGMAYFDGYTDPPTSLSLEHGHVRLAPEPIRTWNLNGALGFSRSTLRSELAWTPDYPHTDGEGDRWQLVVGWDRTFFTNLYVNLQLFSEKLEEGDSVEGGTFAITNLFLEDSATAGLRGQWAKGCQLAYEVFFEYQWTDSFEIVTRAMLFDGDSDTPLGDFVDNDFAELAVRWSW